MKESATTDHVRLFAAENGAELWRNNNGAFKDETGRMVFYGLANDSKRSSEFVKSSDFIGIMPTIITAEHIGQLFGRFLAVEMKPSDWVFPKPTNIKEYKRCLAQYAYHDIVRRAGGLAGFANRRKNLRICTRAQNMWNRKRTHGSSKFKGVYWAADRNKWRAAIYLDSKIRVLGSFLKEEDAARAYNKAAKKTFGKYACLNVIGGKS